MKKKQGNEWNQEASIVLILEVGYVMRAINYYEKGLHTYMYIYIYTYIWKRGDNVLSMLPYNLKSMNCLDKLH
jgi:hypothetical protein